jgi:putative ABC transport system permease protein
MLLTGVGIVIGLVVSYGFTKSLASLLYGISATDFYSFTAAALLFFVVGIAACWIPARRAMLADPIVAVRYE